jgi:predicted Zn-dependent protease
MTVERFTPAHQPDGVTVQIQTNAGTLSGELIEVSDSRVIVLSGNTLRGIPYSAIAKSRVNQTNISIDARNIAPRRDRLRLLSRYPQGLTPEMLRALLNAYGQAELASVER